MSDPVNSPTHYQGAGGLEAIDVIEGFELGFRLGNAVKYILRAGRKGDAVEDLKKARWYLEREIASRANDDKPEDAKRDVWRCLGCAVLNVWTSLCCTGCARPRP